MRPFLRGGLVFARRCYLDGLRADETPAGFAVDAARFQGASALLPHAFVPDGRDPGMLRRLALGTEF